ncbi:MAG: major capsid protein [Pseudomonadota bacterium]
MVNPFTADSFSMMSLSQSMEVLPNQYDRLERMNLFTDKPVRTRDIAVESRNGVLCLLPSQPVGAPGTKGSHAKRVVRSFQVPHIPHDDVIVPSEFQGLRAHGSETELAALEELVSQKLRAMKNKHDQTLEWLRMGALKGIIVDGDGSTVLYNLFTEFGISPKTVDFVLGTGTTDVKGKVREVVLHIEDNAKGDTFRGINCDCSPEFFDAFTNHAEVKEVVLTHSEASSRYGEDNRHDFRFGGVSFTEYRGTADDAEGNSHKFITAKDAHFYPVGGLDTFHTSFAPGNFIETANTLGQRLYAKLVPRSKGDGIDLFTESNPLPMCARPGMLVRGYTA